MTTTKIMIAAIFVFTATAALANEGAVFSATSKFRKQGWNSQFSALEQMGVERAAEKQALAKCYASGANECVILGTATITKCNSGETELEMVYCGAVAQSRALK